MMSDRFFFPDGWSALCLRELCSRLWTSDRSYPCSAKAWSSLFVGTAEPRTHFEEGHGEICFGSCISPSKALSLWFCYRISKLDCVVAPFLWWWEGLQRAYGTHDVLHKCTVQCWEMARTVPNQSCQKRCPKWEYESITMCLLSLFLIYLQKKRKQPCSKPLLAKSTQSSCISVWLVDLFNQSKFWVWSVIRRFLHWHFLSISKIPVLRKSWQWPACSK